MTLFCGLLYNELYGSIQPYMEYSKTLFCYCPTNSFLTVIDRSNISKIENSIETITLHQILYKFIQWYELQKCHFAIVKNMTKKKYTILQTFLENPFFNNTTRVSIVNAFGNAQRKWLALNRFAFLWKWNHADIAVNTDLLFNTLNPDEDSCIILMQNKARFCFRMTDLLRIIESALCHDWYDDFIVNPKMACNPYNKMPFSRVHYYNMYIHMLQNTRMIIPSLFQLWIHNECEPAIFAIRCERQIRQKCIEHFVFSFEHTNSMAYNDIMQMIESNRVTRKWNIHPKFCRKKIIDTLRSCLYYYYLIEYNVLSIEERVLYEAKLWAKLIAIYRKNPKFGQITNDMLGVTDFQTPYYFNSFEFELDVSGAASPPQPYTPYVFGTEKNENDNDHNNHNESTAQMTYKRKLSLNGKQKQKEKQKKSRNHSISFSNVSIPFYSTLPITSRKSDPDLANSQDTSTSKINEGFTYEYIYTPESFL